MRVVGRVTQDVRELALGCQAGEPGYPGKGLLGINFRPSLEAMGQRTGVTQSQLTHTYAIAMVSW